MPPPSSKPTITWLNTHVHLALQLAVQLVVQLADIEEHRVVGIVDIQLEEQLSDLLNRSATITSCGNFTAWLKTGDCIPNFLWKNQLELACG